jgi:hypothetical protein
MDPVGFWISNLRNNWQTPVSKRLISTSGVFPINERIAGFAIWGGNEVGAEAMRFNFLCPVPLRQVDTKVISSERQRPALVDAMGIARLLDEQQPDNINNKRPTSALTEEVSKNNDVKRIKAKQILLGQA